MVKMNSRPRWIIYQYYPNIWNNVFNTHSHSPSSLSPSLSISLYLSPILSSNLYYREKNVFQPKSLHVTVFLSPITMCVSIRGISSGQRSHLLQYTAVRFISFLRYLSITNGWLKKCKVPYCLSVRTWNINH